MFDLSHLKRPATGEGHSTSLTVVPLIRNTWYCAVESMSLSCTVLEILTPIDKIVIRLRRMTLGTSTWAGKCVVKANASLGQRTKIWSLYLQPFHRYFRGCKILKWVTWPWPRHFQEWFVIGKLGRAMFNVCTTFEVPTLHQYQNIFGARKLDSLA